MSEILAVMNQDIKLVQHMLLETHPSDHVFEDDTNYPGVCAACMWVSPDARFNGESLRAKLQGALSDMIHQRDLYESRKGVLIIPFQGGVARIETMSNPLKKK